MKEKIQNVRILPLEWMITGEDQKRHRFNVHVTLEPVVIWLLALASSSLFGIFLALLTRN
jgi:hypothetical protein